MQTAADLQHENEHLKTLLNKLRPFQRKAFDFAVHGILPDDNGEDGAQKKRPSINSASVSGQHHKNNVAGAGTGRILLADEMGLGKTISSLAIMSAYQQNEWPLLILCPASLRYTWPAEIEKFLPWITPQSTHVVRGADDVTFAAEIVKWRKKQREQQLNNNDNKPKKKPPYQIIICTYSLLQSRWAVSKALQNCNFQCVIADESHNLKDNKSQRCQLALPIMKKAKRLVLLSGTPALNRPVELYPQLTALDPTGRLFPGEGNMNFTQYTRRYCAAKQKRFGWDVKGISNADELHQCLKKIMLRRLKSQVLQDLPSKQRSIVPIIMKDAEKIKESKYVMLDWAAVCKARDNISDLDADDVAQAAVRDSQRAMMQAYQAGGVAKASAVAEYIIDWLRGCDSTQKLVVFAHHQDVMNAISTAISTEFKGKLGMMRIDGSVSPQERAKRVKQFQTNKGVRLALLSMTAAGVGLTLTAASNIIFAELHWTPGVLAQAEDRCHRIGQQSSVNVTYCICKDEDLSIDMAIWKMLTNKTGNLSKIVDGERKGLDAVETSISVKSNAVGSGVSAEAELVNFFSNATSTQTSSRINGPPVKGTIQSFFKKQVASKESSKVKAPPSASNKSKGSGKTSPNSVTCISLLDNDDEVDSFVNCPACTFENKVSTNVCTMCSSPIDAMSSTPTLNVQNEKEAWACAACTFANKYDLLACEVCGTSRQQDAQDIQPLHLPDQSSSSDEFDDESVSVMDTDLKPAWQGCKTDIDDSIDMDVDRKAVQPLQLPDQSSSSSDDESGDDSDESLTSDHAYPTNSINGHDQNNNCNRKGGSRPRSTCAESECIDLTQVDECKGEPKPSKFQTPRCNYSTSLLRFSVSKNSGRIALHSTSGESLNVNFDISQIVTKECSEKLEEVKLSRKSPKERDVLQFDDEAIRQVISELDGSTFYPASTVFQKNFQSMCDELKMFVSCYFNLREIEKKQVKDSGKAIASSDITQVAARLLQNTVSGSTDRYKGSGSQALGAKERAIENQRNNVATDLDNLVLAKKACAWCAELFQTQNLTVDVDATYCSWKCAEEGRIRRGNMYSSSKIRAALFELEHGVCQMCHIDAHGLFERIKCLQPAERLNALLNANFKLPSTKRDRFLQNPEEHDFWQADHIHAVAEGGGGTGLDNFRTLCTPCHRIETSKLHSRLKSKRLAEGNEGSGKQLDIMSAFSKVKSAKKKRKRKRVAD
jgi:SWI/SNF-related matrix-associated actin-dependent regulator 1 of chromatin subfamily A